MLTMKWQKIRSSTEAPEACFEYTMSQLYFIQWKEVVQSKINNENFPASSEAFQLKAVQLHLLNDHDKSVWVKIYDAEL